MGDSRNDHIRLYSPEPVNSDFRDMAGKSIYAQVTPSVLQWARLDAGYKTPEDAVSHLPKAARTTPAMLREWEAGTLLPRMTQAKALAKLYHRPLTLFYLPTPPPVRMYATEYRRLRSVVPGEESPKLRIALRGLTQRRKDALRLLDELNEEVKPFTLSAKQGEQPSAIASRIREALGITFELQKSWSDKYKAWSGWRRAIESLNTLVMQFPDVEMNEIRGVSLYYDELPIIGVNSKEDASARPYTALHELIHLALRKAGQESSAISEARSVESLQLLEKFVERVASEVLMPEAEFLEFWGNVSSTSGPSDQFGFSHRALTRLAKRFTASPKAAATRLQILGKLSWNEYRAWQNWWDEINKKSEGRREGKPSGPPPYKKALSNHGPAYSWLVFDALAANRIQGAEASEMMGLSPDQLQRAHLALVQSSFQSGATTA